MRHLWILLIILIAFAGLSSHVFAQSAGTPPKPNNGPVSIPLPDPFGGKTAQVILKAIVVGLQKIALPIVAIMVIVGGFQIITAGGNSDKFTKGRNTLLYAAIGLIIILIASGVATLLTNVLSGN